MNNSPMQSVQSAFTGVSQPFPRGFDNQVKRLRNAQVEKEMQNNLNDKRMRGEEFDKVKLAKMKPPSFMAP